MLKACTHTGAYTHMPVRFLKWLAGSYLGRVWRWGGPTFELHMHKNARSNKCNTCVSMILQATLQSLLVLSLNTRESCCQRR